VKVDSYTIFIENTNEEIERYFPTPSPRKATTATMTYQVISFIQSQKNTSMFESHFFRMFQTQILVVDPKPAWNPSRQTT